MTARRWVVLIVGLAVGFAAAAFLESGVKAYGRSLVRRTAADCSSVSLALEKYRADKGTYPPLDGPIENLRPFLVPKYIPHLPTRDSTGRPLIVMLRGTRAAVVSTGTHGVVVEAGELVSGPLP